LNHPTGLVVDGTDTYWVTGDGLVLRCPIGGCAGTAVQLATGQDFALGRVVAVTDSLVVWTSFGVGLLDVAK
jgi:hypothetical protein